MANKDSVAFQVPVLDDVEVTALHHLRDGTASPYEQKLALAVIVNKFSRAHDVLYVPGSFDESAFLSGRGFVGQQVLKHINLPVGKLQQKVSDNHD